MLRDTSEDLPSPTMTDHFITDVWMSTFIGLIVLTLVFAVLQMLKGKKR